MDIAFLQFALEWSPRGLLTGGEPCGGLVELPGTWGAGRLRLGFLAFLRQRGRGLAGPALVRLPPWEVAKQGPLLPL